MTRKLVSGLVLALVLTWGSSAMAQIAPQPECGLTGDINHVLTFPYFAGKLDSDGWWSGMAIINTTGNAIPAADLCVVGVYNAVQTGVKLSDTLDPNRKLDEPDKKYEELGANSMYVNLVDGIDGRFASPGTALAVFSNNAHAENLRGFGMVGDWGSETGMGQGQGYLALRGDHVEGAKELEIPYAPGTSDNDPWWRGLAVFNNDGQARDITFTAYYQDGTTNSWTKESVPANGMVVGLPGTVAEPEAIPPVEAFFPAYKTGQRARIVITSEGNIFAFAMFGDQRQAQGLVAPN